MLKPLEFSEISHPNDAFGISALVTYLFVGLYHYFLMEYYKILFHDIYEEASMLSLLNV